MTERDLLDAIEKYGQAVPRRPEGKGWYTIEEMAKKKGVSVPAMRYRFKLALAAGVKIEQATGSAPTPDGRLRRAIYYRAVTR